MNLSTASSAWRVFKAGESVANPAAWKQGQVTANMVTLLLVAVVALLKGLGYDLHVDDGTLTAVGTGVFALVNWLLTIVSTDKVGVFGQRAAPGRDPDLAPVPAAVAVAAAVAVPSVGGSAPADAGVRAQPDGLSRQDGESMQAGG